MKKHLTSGIASSYSNDMMPTISAERILFEIEVLKQRLDDLTKRVTPLLQNYHADNKNQQILIKKTAHLIN